jgi:hypothetical protein
VSDNIYYERSDVTLSDSEDLRTEVYPTSEELKYNLDEEKKIIKIKSKFNYVNLIFDSFNLRSKKLINNHIQFYILFKYNKMTDTNTNTNININMDKDMSMSMSDYIFNEEGTKILNNIIAARKISPTATYDALVVFNKYITEKLLESNVINEAK